MTMSIIVHEAEMRKSINRETSIENNKLRIEHF